jgi:hypothetical protein
MAGRLSGSSVALIFMMRSSLAGVVVHLDRRRNGNVPELFLKIKKAR